MPPSGKYARYLAFRALPRAPSGALRPVAHIRPSVKRGPAEVGVASIEGPQGRKDALLEVDLPRVGKLRCTMARTDRGLDIRFFAPAQPKTQLEILHDDLRGLKERLGKGGDEVRIRLMVGEEEREI